MAFAPYHNVSRIDEPAIKGCFTNRETKVNFEFTTRSDRYFPESFAPDFPDTIFVGPAGEERRLARIHKTVVKVVVDEAADGSPVVESWPITKYRRYTFGQENPHTPYT